MGVSVVVQIGLVVPVLAGCGVVFYVPAAVARRMLGCEAMLLFWCCSEVVDGKSLLLTSGDVGWRLGPPWNVGGLNLLRISLLLVIGTV